MRRIKYIKMKTQYFLFLLLGVVLFSCKDPKTDEAFLTLDDMPAASYMKANASDFSMWVDLLEYTDLFNALNLNNNYTCFVPTNEALTEFLNSKGKSSVRELEIGYATTLVKYHVIPTTSKRYTQSLFQNGVIPDTTASGDYLSIDIREGGINAIYVNSEARIKKLDIEVINAVIHVIEKVLNPITETIWDKISVDPKYSIMKNAIHATGYNILINTINYKSTLFAVTDSIFNTKSITDTTSLASYLGAGADYRSTQNLLNKYIAYHILPQQMSFAELSTFTANTTTKNINTLAFNEIISLSDVNGTLLINNDTSLNKRVKLIAINNTCKNGVIHKVDDLMPVYSPKPAPFLWEFTDYSELATKFSSVYRIRTLTSNSINELAQGAVSCYKWQTVLPENMNSAVTYYVHKNTEERYKALNADYLRLRLRLYGWAEMVTPAIVKGTYNLKLAHYSPKSTSYKFSLVLDGVVIGLITLPADGSKDLYYSNSVIATNLVLNSTSEHIIRIIANDNNELELDYILFEPVN